jgi:hypothetical protein
MDDDEATDEGIANGLRGSGEGRSGGMFSFFGNCVLGSPGHFALFFTIAHCQYYSKWFRH